MLERAWLTAQVVARPLRLLLVEDHVDSAELLAELLENHGHTVRVAGTASDALARASEEPFDLVVSDVGLPDATGYELMEQLRDRFALKGIALTGVRETHLVREAGFVAYLSKPITVRRLEQTLQNVAREL
jgi:CheY-like chemotaxis protein